MNGHTPGPWQWRRQELEPNVLTLGDDGACGDPDCCGSPSYHIELSDANARLIAAAPDLLNALQESVGLLESYLKDFGPCDHSVNICYCGDQAVLERARAVLAAAVPPSTEK